MGRRARRTFAKEYEAEGVELVRQVDMTIGALSSDLDLTESAIVGVDQVATARGAWRFCIRESPFPGRP